MFSTRPPILDAREGFDKTTIYPATRMGLALHAAGLFSFGSAKLQCFTALQYD